MFSILWKSFFSKTEEIFALGREKTTEKSRVLLPVINTGNTVQISGEKADKNCTEKYMDKTGRNF